jgi:hypothetical protein
MSNEPEPGAVPADVEGLARHRFYALGLKHWDAFWLGWCESAALRGRVVPHKEGCDGGEFTCICSYATGRVVGGKDVAADRAEYEAWYASRGWSQPVDGAWADFGWKVWQAAVERAAPLHDLAVGRDGLQHDASDSRSSPPSLPLTGGKQ